MTHHKILVFRLIFIFQILRLRNFLKLDLNLSDISSTNINTEFVFDEHRTRLLVDCGSRLEFNGLCYDECPRGTINNAGVCQQCSNGNYEINLVTGKQCIASCPVYSITVEEPLNELTLKYCYTCDDTDFPILRIDECHERCEKGYEEITVTDTLDGVERKYCSYCETGLYDELSKCVNTCSIGFLSDESTLCQSIRTCNNICGVQLYDAEDQSCDDFCDYGKGQIENGGVCHICSTNLNGFTYLMNGECLAECPRKTYIYTETQGMITSNTCTPCSLELPYEYEFTCFDACPFRTFDTINEFECVYYDCPEDQYFSNSTCEGSCSPGYYYDEFNSCLLCPTETSKELNNLCVEFCPGGYKDVNNKCELCSPETPLVLDNECTDICPGGYIITDNVCILCTGETTKELNNICVDICPGGYTDDSNKCVLCSPETPLVLDNVCIDICPGGYIILDNVCTLCTGETTKELDNICVDICPGGYTDDNNKCNLCDESTPYVLNNTCQGNCPGGYIIENNICILCTENTTKELNNVCIDACPGGYTDNSNKCNLCPEETPLVLNNTCQNGCPGGYIIENNVCVLCPIETPKEKNNICVVSCSEGGYTDTSNKCTQCNSLTPLIHNNICVSTCLKGYIITDNVCIQCPIETPNVLENSCVLDCPAEYELKLNTCVKCSAPTPIIYNGECLATCPNLTYQVGLTCASCGVNRINKEGTGCVPSCPLTQYLDTQKNKCSECLNTTDVILDNNCVIECPFKYILQEKTCVLCSGTKSYYDVKLKLCVSTCSPSQVKDESQKTCSTCSATSKYRVDDLGTCVAECPLSYFTDDTNLACINIEGKYILGKTVVTNCPDNTIIKGQNCIKCSENSQFYDKELKQCVNTCGEKVKVPLSENSKVNPELARDQICIECPSNIVQFEKDTATCFAECPQGTYEFISTDGKSKVCKKCPTETTILEGKGCGPCPNSLPYISESKCSSNCSSLLGIQMSSSTTGSKICGNCLNGQLLFSDGICKPAIACDKTKFVLDESTKKCIDCSSNTVNNIFFNNQCLSKCPDGYIPDAVKICVKADEANSDISSSSNTSTSDTSKDTNQTPVVKLECQKGYEKLTVGGKEMCKTCKEVNKYTQNGACVIKCSSEATVDEETKECNTCSGKYTIIREGKSECLEKCDNSLGFFINESNSNICEDCKRIGKFVKENKCVANCGSGMIADSSKECKKCEETDLKYLMDGVCVKECPADYKTSTIVGYEFTCAFVRKDPTCEEFCTNDGICSYTVSGERRCTCPEGYYGLTCNLTDTDLDSLKSESKQIISELASVTENRLMTDDERQQILNVRNTLESAPEIIDEKTVTDFIGVAEKQLRIAIESGAAENVSVLDTVDAAFSVRKFANSTEQVEQIKQAIESMTKDIIASKGSIEAFLKQSSSILYGGEAFKIQISDNSPKSLKEARENKLPIVDFSECEEQLKSSGLVGKDEKLYARNINYDPSLLADVSAVSGSITASKGMSTEIIDSENKVVDTSSCDSFIMKQPINNNIINTDSYKKVKGSQGADIYNSTQPFFNDICNSFPSENGTDITLNSRRSKFNVTSSCSNDCDYQYTDEHDYSVCDCKYIPKENVGKFENSLFGSLEDSNLKLFKCIYKLPQVGLKTNTGFWTIMMVTLTASGAVVGHLLLFNAAHALESIVNNDAVTLGPGKVGTATTYKNQNHVSEAAIEVVCVNDPNSNSNNKSDNKNFQIEKNININADVIPIKVGAGKSNNNIMIIEDDDDIIENPVNTLQRENTIERSSTNTNYNSLIPIAKNSSNGNIINDEISNIDVIGANDNGLSALTNSPINKKLTSISKFKNKNFDLKIEKINHYMEDDDSYSTKYLKNLVQISHFQVELNNPISIYNNDVINKINSNNNKKQMHKRTLSK